MTLPRKFFLDRVDSTNRWALKKAARSTSFQPFWIRTDDQFAGRGQGENSWQGSPGQNLTGSLVIYPDQLLAGDQFLLSVLASEAMVDFTGLFTGEITIKWPNDLYFRDKKLGGLLIENSIVGEMIRYTVLGIGININQTDFPESLPNPVSLSQIHPVTYNLTEIEDLLLNCLMNRLSQLKTNKSSDLLAAYTRKLYRYRQFATYNSQGKLFNAQIVGVDNFGRLRLEDETGKLRTYGFQEVEYVI